MAPTAHHRLLFRCGDKEHVVQVANRYALAGLACIGVAMLGAPAFAGQVLEPGPLGGVAPIAAATAMTWCWWVLPIRRRRAITAAGAVAGRPQP
jgi:hypothetical protein